MPVDNFDDDIAAPFQIGDAAVRGRVVRLGGAINEILARHNFSENVSELVGEAAVLAAMVGSALKFDGKLIFQAQGDGPVSMVVADFVTGGAIRATASLSDQAQAAGRGVSALLGKGHMAMTIDQGSEMERYQGVTPLEGEDIAAATVAYFAQSEQIPTAVKLAVGRISRAGAEDQWRAGGIIAQFMPGEGGSRERGEAFLNSDDDREMWNRIAVLLETAKADELLDPQVSANTLLYRLFNEDGVKVFETTPLHAECGCNAQKIGAVLTKYSNEELADMVEDGLIRVTCEFCREGYLFTADGEPRG